MIRHLLAAVAASGVLGMHAPRWLCVLAAAVALLNVLAALAHD